MKLMIDRPTGSVLEHASPDGGVFLSLEAAASRETLDLKIGSGAVHLLVGLDTIKPVEGEGIPSDMIGVGGLENMSSNPEGRNNAELFKQAYDAAIESIDRVLIGEGELDSKLATALDRVDALGHTPYISSVPEFVDLLRAARSTIEQVNSSMKRGNSEVTFAADNLVQAKRYLAGTTVAYRPE